MTHPHTTQVTSTPGLLSTLTAAELAAADRRYPKWATMCQLRRLGLPVLDAVLITPGRDHQALAIGIATLAAATRPGPADDPLRRRGRDPPLLQGQQHLPAR